MGRNRSIDFKLDLGWGTDGQPAGRLWIKRSKPHPVLATPEWLRFDKVRGDIEVIRDSGVLRQVKTPQVLADIEPPTSVYWYTIKLYDSAHWGTFSGGLWNPGTNTPPYLTWRIENPDASSTTYNRLRISKYVGTDTNPALTYEYEWDEQTQTLELTTYDSESAPIRVESRTDSTDGDGNLVQTYNLTEGGSLVYEAVETYLEGFHGKLIRKEIGTSSNPVVITREYYTNPNETGKYKRFRSFTNSDGSWEMRDYDSQGRITTQIMSWKDVPMPSTLDTTVARTIQYSYTPISGTSDNGSLYPENPRTVTETIGNITVSKSYHVYYTDSGDEVAVDERCADVSSSYGDSDNLRTITRYTPAGANNNPPRRLKSVETPDGRKDTYTWEQGTYTPANPQDEPGTFTSGGTDVRRTVVHGTTGSPDGVANRTTKEVTITNAAGIALEEKTYVYDGSAYQLVSWGVQAVDDRGRVTDVYFSNGVHASAEYDCCVQTSKTDGTGIRFTYTYDDMKRLLSETQTGVSASGSYPAQSDITTTHEPTADSNGQIWTTTVSAGGLSRVTKTFYDTAGRVIKTRDEADLDTLTEYDFDEDGAQIVTVTRPGGATEVTTHYLDGRVKTITGTGVVHRFHDRGVTDGLRWMTVFTGPDLDESPMWHETTLDPLGRTVEERRPGYNESTVITTHEYYTDNDPGHAKGLLARTSTTAQADTLYEYDALRHVSRSGMDRSENGSLDLESLDRVTDTDSSYWFDGTRWWSKRLTKVYATDDDDTATPVSEHLELLSGFASGEIIRTKLIDVHGNETVTSVTVNRGTNDALRLVTTTVNVPHSTADEVAVTRNGLLQSSKSQTNLTTTYSYDALGRRTGVTDPRGNTTTTAYYTSGVGAEGKVQSVTDEATNTTTYAYYDDESTMAGRLKSITNALSKTQYFEYNAHGQQTRTWGETTYPVEYGYDDYGRRTTMSTFRGGSGWDGATWPTSTTGDADVTTWVYEEATGLLLEKQYDDHTPQNPRNIEYTYTDEGKLETRTWSRSGANGRITTTYDYDPDTGELTDMSYNDGVTPPVGFSYDRLGRQTSIDDTVGTREFVYNAYLQLETEEIGTEIGNLYNKLITRKYWDNTSAHNGKDKGFQIGVSGTPAADYEVTYNYNALSGGRLMRIEGAALPDYGVQYSWVTGSDMVSKAEFKSNSSTILLRTTYAPEAERDLIESVEHERVASPGGTIATYDYVNDAIGRRTAVVNTGDAFADDAFTLWGYNTRSELTSSERYEGEYDPTPDSGDEITAERRLYNYDPIGNRIDATSGASNTTYYCANELNQYLTLDDADDTCPQSPADESFTYDADGNLTQDGTFDYTWDAENRLTAVTPVSPVNGNKKLEFKYDYMNRRVQKKVWTYNSGWGSPTQDLRFVYDRWNVVLVLDGLDDNASVRKYTWGLDLSGQRGAAKVEGIHNAGGIGGLLAVEETAESGTPKYWFLYDANGNVGQVVKNTTSYPLSAHYEYDAYGNTIVADDVDSSDYVDVNPFRFSTKWFDAESGLVLYPRRPYLARLGRWTTRDPIAEEGGLNLYIGMGNNTVDLVDPLGLDPLSNEICDLIEKLRHLRELARKAATAAEYWRIRAQISIVQAAIRLLQSARNIRVCPLIGPDFCYRQPKPGDWY